MRNVTSCEGDVGRTVTEPGMGDERLSSMLAQERWQRLQGTICRPETSAASHQPHTLAHTQTLALQRRAPTLAKPQANHAFRVLGHGCALNMTLRLKPFD